MFALVFLFTSIFYWAFQVLFCSFVSDSCLVDDEVIIYALTSLTLIRIHQWILLRSNQNQRHYKFIKGSFLLFLFSSSFYVKNKSLEIHRYENEIMYQLGYGSI